MKRSEFRKLVEEGIQAVPQKFLKKLNNVAVVIEDEPTPGQLQKTGTEKDWVLFGLYEGVPQTERWNYGLGEVMPDKITIFRKAIEEEAESAEEIKEIVKTTVWHEIAHHFGMDETEVEEAEQKHEKTF